MKSSRPRDLPKARKDGLVTREVRGELLVYDLKRHKAFCLNNMAAAVWRSCDGRRSVRELAGKFDRDEPVDEKVIWLALDQLEKSNLLQRKVLRPAGVNGFSRRDLLRLGLVSAATLPVVFTILAPTAQAAGSPIPSTTCMGRHNSDPGGCGGNPCSDVPGQSCKQNGSSNACKCQP